jgi:predicted ATPase/DNA-binding SARP family transcriptional activator
MSQLALSFLGPFQVTFDSVPVEGFESDKVRALLAYLAVKADQPHRRDSLAAMLWPEQRQEIALKNLRHVLYKLRQVLGEGDQGGEGPGSKPPCLLVTAHTVQFDGNSDFRLDLREFERLMAASRAHRHRRLEVCGSCHLRLKSAAELYRGDFLAGFALADSTDYEEWMLLEREALHQQALQALIHLATYSESQGDYVEAARYARRQIELEPWREEAHRQLMRILWRTGERSAALAQYQACQRALSGELGIEPGPETTELYRHILASGNNIVAASQGENKASALSEHPPTYLPGQLTPFVGREKELALIAERLESYDRRLLTLVGPGGTGKSRLALAAAAAHVGAFEDGVYFVPMAPVESPGLIVSAIVEALSLRFSGNRDDKAQLLEYLSDKEMLLVMDNFEHLLEGTDLILEISRRAPRVSLLLTSRERLDVQAEMVMKVVGLPFPPVTPGVPGLPSPIREPSGRPEELARYASVQLFVERAQAGQEDFALTTDNASAVAQICQIVGGLPLAIELAAARARDFSCQQIADEIQRNLDFLATGARDVPPEHRSMRAVFDYSWGLLGDEEKGLFPRLSVFRGGCDREAAEQVAGASLELLASLAGKSLVQQVMEGGEVRYDIHEVLRQYAAERLDSMPDEKVWAQTRHAEHYLALAERAEPHLRGPQQAAWLGRLEREHANLQAAIRWATENGHVGLGLRLGGALWQFWVMHAHYATGRELLAGFDLQSAERSSLWAKALLGAGRLAMQQSDFPTAHQFMDESLAMYQESGDDAAVRQLLVEHARVYRRQGDWLRGQPLSEEALRLARMAGDRQVIASALTNLGSIAINLDSYSEARKLYEECLLIQHEMGDKWGIAWTLTDLGTLAQYENNTERSRTLFEESLALRREIGDKWGIATCLSNLGSVAIDEGKYSLARRFVTEALFLRRELGDMWAVAESIITIGQLEYVEGNAKEAQENWGEALRIALSQGNLHVMAFCLTGLAAAILQMGHAEQAAHLAGVVASLLDSLGVHLSPSFQAIYDELVVAGEAELGKDAWAAAWSRGRMATPDSACATALAWQGTG